MLVALASLLALSSLIMMLFRPGNSFGGENSNGQTRCVLDDKDVEAYIRNSGSVNSERIALIGLLKNLSFREKKNREASDSLALIRISKREVFNIVREGRVNMQISCYTLYGQPVQDLMAIAQPSSMDQLFTISDSLLTFSKGKPENMSVYDEAFYDVRHHLLSPTEDAEVLAEAIKTVVESVQQVQLEHVADYLSAQRKQAHN